MADFGYEWQDSSDEDEPLEPISPFPSKEQPDKPAQRHQQPSEPQHGADTTADCCWTGTDTTQTTGDTGGAVVTPTQDARPSINPSQPAPHGLSAGLKDAAPTPVPTPRIDTSPTAIGAGQGTLAIIKPHPSLLRGKDGHDSAKSPTSPTAEATAAAAGVTVDEVLEPRRRDPSKEQQVRELERSEANLTPLQIIVRRSSSFYIYQRVWAAKELSRILDELNSRPPATDSVEIKKHRVTVRDGLEILVPTAMRLVEDPNKHAKSTMIWSLEPVLLFYYIHVREFTDKDGAGEAAVLGTYAVRRNGVGSEASLKEEEEEEEDEDEENEDNCLDQHDSSNSSNSSSDIDLDDRPLTSPLATDLPLEEQARPRPLCPPSTSKVGESVADADLAEDMDREDKQISDTGASETDANEQAPGSPIPTIEGFRFWLHTILLASQPQLSVPIQRAVVSLGHHLPFDEFHTHIIHGIILGLVPNDFEQQMQRVRSGVIKSRPNSHEPSPMFGPLGLSSPSTPDGVGSPSPAAIVATKPNGGAANSGGSGFSFGFASLFGRRSPAGVQLLSSPQPPSSEILVPGANSDSEDDDGDDDGRQGRFVFVSPQEEEARAEKTRRKLLMLHMIHLTAVEFGRPMRLAVFVPVVEKSSRDKAFQVRRDVAAMIGSLTKAVSHELAMDMLFPAFMRLVEDKVWQVRESLARHSLADMATVLGPLSSPSSFSISPSPSLGANGNYRGAGAKIQKTRSASLVPSATNSLSNVLASSLTLSPPTFRKERAQQQDSYQVAVDATALDRSQRRRNASLHLSSELTNPISGSDGKTPQSRQFNKHWSTGSPNILSMTASPPSIIGSFSFGGASSSSSSLSPPPSSLSTAKTIGAGNIPPSVVEPKIVTERQWVSIIDQLTGSAEPSARVRSAFFESVGKLLVALGPSTKLKDHIIELLITTVNNAYAKTGYNGGRMSIEDEDDDGGGGGGGRWSGGVPSEVIYHIAFNFPALAAVLSKEGWPRIAPTYQNLVKMDYFDVRKTLASSLHEISAIAGNQEETLCIFLMEPHEIRSAVIAHLGDTLKAFTPVARERCLPIILQVFDLEGKDWRTRQTMAEQLVQVCSLYPTLTVVNKLLPLAVRWAKDSVAGVRKSVAHAFPVIFGQAKNHPDALVTFFERVIGFATADSFRGRLFFIEMCTSLVLREDPDSDPLEFDQFFLPSLAKLANDPVVNVRIALARLVARLMSNKKRRRASVSGKSMRGELLAEMLGTLQKDTDRDVKDLIKNVA